MTIKETIFQLLIYLTIEVCVIGFVNSCTAIDLCDNYCKCRNDSNIQQFIIDCSSITPPLDSRAAFTLDTSCLGKQDILLDLSNNHFEKLDTKISQTRNVKSLILTNCLLHNIDAYIQGYTDVDYLDLSKNHFQLIPRSLSDSIKHFNVSYNQLNYIEKFTIGHLRSLVFLGLQHNSIVSLASNTFSNLMKLQHLDMSYNRLTHVDDNTFKTLKSLHVLNLKHNKLTTVSFTLPLLDRLDISHNSIAEISERAKPSIYPIEIIIFSHNPLNCDCKLLWLKELWDRREYLVDHIDMSHGDYVPVCQTPMQLKDEPWDLLADSAFTCDEEYTDNLLVDNSNAVVSPLSTNDNLEALNVTDNSVLLKLPSASAAVKMFVIEYYEFGQKSTILTHHVDTDYKKHTLYNLKSSTAYVMCLTVEYIITDTNIDDGPTCVEVITLEQISPWQAFVNRYGTLDNHLTVLVLYCFGVPLILLILIMICHDCAFLPLLQMFTDSPKKRHKKLHID